MIPCRLASRDSRGNGSPGDSCQMAYGKEVVDYYLLIWNATERIIGVFTLEIYD
jgi:hypothetical protein